MRVLVTGGSGFIGRHVVRRLTERGDDVRVLDLKPFPGDTDCVIGDIRDAAAVERALTKDFDGVVHLAALTSVLQSVNEPDAVFSTNGIGTHLLLERCRTQQIEHFVFSSTNAVVGDIGATKIDELAPLRPLTPYGATKAAAEMLFSAYAGSYGMKTVALRFTNVYGAGMQTKDSVIARLMKSALNGGSIEIYGDGEQLRDYLYVTDAASALEFGLGLGHPATLTIGAAESVSMNTLYELVCDVTGVQIPMTHIAGKPGEMPAVIVDTSRAHAAGWSPRFTVKEGIAETWQDFRISQA